ncbi:MAG: hypothetical protein JW884_05270 [Deltaproteobacteria bacterium]|nr:hypothetical protein [Deltaproteobacteria bacterium]
MSKDSNYNKEQDMRLTISKQGLCEALSNMARVIRGKVRSPVAGAVRIECRAGEASVTV